VAFREKYIKKDVAPGPGEEKKALKFFRLCRWLLCDPREGDLVARAQRKVNQVDQVLRCCGNHVERDGVR
jgi:hypothetical protein